MDTFFSLKPDFEDSFARYEAFWHGTIVDRPPVCLTLPVDRPRPLPHKAYKTLEERWLDVDFRAERIDIELGNRRYLADALPVAWPNMGPRSTPPGAAADTDSAKPRLERSLPRRLGQRWPFPFQSRASPFQKDDGIHRSVTPAGRGAFHRGLDRFSSRRRPPGGPAGSSAAVHRSRRDPEEVKAELFRSQAEFFSVYDLFYEKLREAGMPITSWINLPAQGRYYIPSNDFSCMISPEMFGEFFLPGITQECCFYERSIYHLDGPGALRHLDMLLSIPELDAVQWVPGAGNEGFRRWIPVYQRIQAARKSLYLSVDVSELESVFDSLQPEGVWFADIFGVDDEETAGRVIQRIEQWP
jgi:hypothetical protein